MRGSSFSGYRVGVYSIGLLLATGAFGIADVRADGGSTTEGFIAPSSGNPIRDIADALSSIGIPSLVLGHELLCEYQPARFIAKAQPSIGRMDDTHPFADRNAPGVECGCKVIATGCTWPVVAKPSVECPYGSPALPGPDGEFNEECPEYSIVFPRVEVIAEQEVFWLDVIRALQILQIDPEDLPDAASAFRAACIGWCKRMGLSDDVLRDPATVDLFCNPAPDNLTYTEYACPTSPPRHSLLEGYVRSFLHR